MTIIDRFSPRSPSNSIMASLILELHILHTTMKDQFTKFSLHIARFRQLREFTPRMLTR
jgi:hypothetical protein